MLSIIDLDTGRFQSKHRVSAAKRNLTEPERQIAGHAFCFAGAVHPVAPDTAGHGPQLGWTAGATMLAARLLFCLNEDSKLKFRHESELPWSAGCLDDGPFYERCRPAWCQASSAGSCLHAGAC